MKIGRRLSGIFGADQSELFQSGHPGRSNIRADCSIPALPEDRRVQFVRMRSTRHSRVCPMSADIFKDLTILLVEDHDDTRTYLGLFLARLGARILLARNAFEAVEAVRTFHPNIVLSDISMPDRDGFHLLRDIRGLGTDAGGGVPVIAMTAMVTDPDSAWITNAGFQACLPKPFTAEKLMNLIVKVLNASDNSSAC
jgi:CheY-like chemotaxis protein